MSDHSAGNKLAVVVVGTIICAPLAAKVVQFSWNAFVVPTGMNEIGWLHAYGLMLFASLFKKVDFDEGDNKTAGDLAAEVVEKFVWLWLMFAAIAVVKAFFV